MSWWENPYSGKSGPASIVFSVGSDSWLVDYNGQTVVITPTSILDGLDPAATINAFIAATDRGEPFNGLSRESSPPGSGDPAQPQSGTRPGYTCQSCGQIHPQHSDLCRDCTRQLLGPALSGNAGGGLNSQAIAPITPGAAGVNLSALNQLIAQYKSKRDDTLDALFYGIDPLSQVGKGMVRPLPTVQSTLAAQRQKSADMRNMLLFGSTMPLAAYLGMPAAPKAWIDAPDMPVPCSGFVMGEIIAWRAWQISKNGYLKSLSQDAVWPPGEPMEGRVNSAEHGEGVYAFKDRNNLFCFLSSDPWAGIVWGSVALWGDVIEHELGYRAQFCAIRSIECGWPLPSISHQIIDHLRECYGLGNDR